MKRLKASLRTTSLVLLIGLAATAQPTGLGAQTTDISAVWEVSTVLFGETWRVERFTFRSMATESPVSLPMVRVGS